MNGRRATRDDSEESPPSFQPEGLPDDLAGRNPIGELRSRSFGTRDQDTFATTSQRVVVAAVSRPEGQPTGWRQDRPRSALHRRAAPQRCSKPSPWTAATSPEGSATVTEP
jgi:hypothetical protein